MKVFVTGATGFVGTAVVQELLTNGHQVLGLARSEEAANKLIAAGAEVHLGDLNDFESLKAGVELAEAVIHLGFVHDFTRFEEVCQLDGKVIRNIGDALIGSNKPFFITSGTALFSNEKIVTEKDIDADNPHPRIETENAADEVASKGVKVAVIRLSPSVHGKGDVIGFVPTMINIAIEKGKSAIIDGGGNFWPAVHRLDAAKLYRLALEHPFESGVRYHAAGEECVSLKEIATCIAERLNIPLVSITEEESAEHFGWFAHFAKLDNKTSSEQTQKNLGWNPEHPTLLEDLQSDVYFPEAQ